MDAIFSMALGCCRCIQPECFTYAVMNLGMDLQNDVFHSLSASNVLSCLYAAVTNSGTGCCRLMSSTAKVPRWCSSAVSIRQPFLPDIVCTLLFLCWLLVLQVEECMYTDDGRLCIVSLGCSLGSQYDAYLCRCLVLKCMSYDCDTVVWSACLVT